MQVLDSREHLLFHVRLYGVVCKACGCLQRPEEISALPELQSQMWLPHGVLRMELKSLKEC